MNTNNPGLKWKILALIIIIFEVGLLFVPGGVITHSFKIITTGCDKKITSAAYYDPYGGGTGTETVFFCGGTPPSEMNPFYQIGSNRVLQMLFSWVFIVAGIFSTHYFYFRYKNTAEVYNLGGLMPCVFFYLFGLFIILL